MGPYDEPVWHKNLMTSLHSMLYQEKQIPWTFSPFWFPHLLDPKIQGENIFMEFKNLINECEKISYVFLGNAY